MSKIKDALKLLDAKKSQSDDASIRLVSEPQVSEAKASESEVAIEPTGKREALPPSPKSDRDPIKIDQRQLRSVGLLPPSNFDRNNDDEFRRIKRPILGNASDQNQQRARLLLVTSAMAGDGKTFCALNLSLSVAQEKDWTVLLVDGDVAKRGLTTALGLDNEPGLLDVLQRPGASLAESILPTDIAGLSILPAGNTNESAPELLGSSRMAELADTLHADDPSRIVILDSAPVLARPESLVMASLVGQCVFVVCAGRTPQHAVIKAIDTMDHSIPINLILNQNRFSDLSAGYGVNYGAKS